MSFQALKFIGSVGIFYLIFLNLDVKNYAIYGIVQSIVVLFSLILSFNIKNSFQKLYSKRYTAKTSNLVILVILIIGTVIFSGFFWIITFSGLVELIFNNSENTPNLFLLFFYSIIYCYKELISSILNAKKNTFFYGVINVFPFLISIPALIFLTNLDINKLLIVISISYIATIFIVAIKNLSFFSIKSYSSNHSMFILKYIFKYTIFSLPPLSAKYLIDVVARSILLSSKGEIAVAILTFASSLFSVFRSIEQGFFKAITPYILINDSKNDHKLSIAKKLIFYQSVFTIVFFALSPFWAEFLKIIFSSKPDEVFVPIILIIMALSMVVSYVKNFFLSKIKKHVNGIRKFYIISTIINMLMLITILTINLTVLNFVLIQLSFATLLITLIKLVIRPM
tara:strand:- start:1889 stop:3079 length:1191 start_codon:yes stop_codon:yes gene_type:complete